MLNMYRKVMFGPIVHEENRDLKDVSLREFVVLGVLIVMIFWIGIFPNTFLSKSEASVKHLIDNYKAQVVQQRVKSASSNDLQAVLDKAVDDKAAGREVLQ